MTQPVVIHVGPEGPLEYAVVRMFRESGHQALLHQKGALAEDVFHAMARNRPPLRRWPDARFFAGLYRHAPIWRPPLEAWRCLRFLRDSLPHAHFLMIEPDPRWSLWRAGRGDALACWRRRTGLPDATLPGLWDEQLEEHRARLEDLFGDDPRLIRLDPTAEGPAEFAQRLGAILPMGPPPFAEWPAPSRPAIGAARLMARPEPPVAPPGWAEDVARFCLGDLRRGQGGNAGLSRHACDWDGQGFATPEGRGRRLAVAQGPDGAVAVPEPDRHFKLLRAEGVVNDILALDRRDPVRIDMEDSRWFGSPQGDALDRPVICHNRRVGAVNAVLWPLPDQHAIGLPGFDPETPPDDIPWDAKEDRLVWRGMISGSEMTEGVKPGAAAHVLLSQLADPALRDEAWERLRNTNRLSFVTRFIDDPDFDIGVVLAWGFRQFASDPLIAPFLRPRMDLHDFRRFRYQLCMTGYDHGSNFIQALDGNGVLLAEDDGWEVFYSGRFRPWRHFIPVARNMTDIRQKLDWARANPDRCREMSRAARTELRSLRDPEARQQIMRLILDGIARAR
ncbi:glycosyl transferase family 90 [Paracoccus sp. PARArs4]|uniref:glycosyl transferase family 90 n=1 Tax=Paracoccus sp. PARArs4 TaxID=2853442 RepID=UPI0024A77A31|nr:glycosyl transferase family 90 [Paracoccus sp. PARArs4]